MAAATTFVGRSLSYWELFSQESEKVDSGSIKRDAQRSRGEIPRVSQ
jgi:hypothetical protein